MNSSPPSVTPSLVRRLLQFAMGYTHFNDSPRESRKRRRLASGYVTRKYHNPQRPWCVDRQGFIKAHRQQRVSERTVSFHFIQSTYSVFLNILLGNRPIHVHASP